MTTFIGLAIADSMFGTTASITRRELTVEDVKSVLDEGVTSCCNPSHSLTLDALKQKHGIEVPVPEKAPFAKLTNGDRIVVLSARFPRRLNEGEVWTEEDVQKAEFKFGIWEVK